MNRSSFFPSITLVLSISTILLTSSLVGFAQSNFKERVLAEYLQVAFTSENAQLAKPEIGKATNLMIQCAAKEGCETAISMLHSVLTAPWLTSKQTVDFDPKNQVSVVLFSDAPSDEKRLGSFLTPDLQQGQQIYEEGIASCNVRAFHIGHTVNSVVVYADQTMGIKKVVSCVLIELARATGINIGPKFVKQWESGGPLEISDDYAFDRDMVGIERLLAIHFQQTTKPNMSKTEVKEVLDKLTFNELTGE